MFAWLLALDCHIDSMQRRARNQANGPTLKSRAERKENASVGERHWQKENKLVSLDFSRQLAGYGLTTAHILYRRPDHPWLLQSYVWQEYDLHPYFPVLNRFLGFWREKLEARLHSVTVAHSRLIKPAEIKAIDGIFRLH